MKDITNIRSEIDAIDQELARLFRRRLEIVADVAASKHERGAPVTDPARERDILSRVTAEVGPEYENGARLFFATLFGIAKARQRTMLNGEAQLVKDIRAAQAASVRFPNRAVVACPGTEGSYAQQATSIMFQLPTILYFTSFEKVFEAVEQGLCPYGILPIENSAAGSVAAVYDLMVKHHFHIARALRLKVDHVLLAARGVKLEDVREVTSHPHALAQCSDFLKSHPQLKAVPGANTAVTAKALAASGRRDAAVIASRACAELYGLDVIAEDIADAVYNYTRFICISKGLEVYPDANKFSIMLSLPHRPGSLNGLISKFAAINVNLTKLESRPIPGMDFEFRFTFDFEAPPSDPAVLGLLAELALDPEIEHFTFLGAYAER
jgi:chorismate mutase/prephenate dehydratase